MDFRVFASKIVHAKLVEAGLVQDGYPSPRTVARWTASGKAPGWVEQAMRDLFGQQKEAAPDWELLLLPEPMQHFLRYQAPEQEGIQRWMAEPAQGRSVSVVDEGRQNDEVHPSLPSRICPGHRAARWGTL